jgi:hypothetical protein
MRDDSGARCNIELDGGIQKCLQLSCACAATNKNLIQRGVDVQGV